MKEFEIPQREVPVTVELRDGRRIEGALFAAPARPDGGRSRLLARLNDDAEEFVPFGCEGRRDLFNRTWLVAIEVDATEIDDPGLGADTGHPLRVLLSTGETLEGSVRYAMRAERRRLSDFLNAAPRFIALHRGRRATLIQCACIVRVEDLA